MSDRPFTHTNTGREVKVKRHGKEVQLIFVCGSRALADKLCDDLLEQLKAGALNMTLMGKPTSIVES